MNNSNIKIGIAGGAGYTAGELIRILLRHPHVKISWIHSNSQTGKGIEEIHADLLGETDLKFSAELNFQGIDVLFLCMGHGQSKVFLTENTVPGSVKIVDLSQDFRPETEGFVYGLPELKRNAIREASKVANPGCFATAIQLALLPLAQAQLFQDEVHVNATTGSTGAGQAPSPTTHFSWRNNNISVYKAFQHQHLKEITQSIKQLQAGFAEPINFIPVRGNFSRGIMATVYTTCHLTLEEAEELYTTYYETHPFVHVSKANPHLKQVVNTNKCILHLEKHGNKLLILSFIDNLAKGASGQAVQNMNLLFGLEESTGLKLKNSAF